MAPGWCRLTGFQTESPRASPLKTIAERKGVLYIQTFSKGAVTLGGPSSYTISKLPEVLTRVIIIIIVL